jgi:hypothetical protein
MNRLIFFFIFFTVCFAGTTAFAQDTLPKFSVKDFGNNRIIIGWVNPFTQPKQISIQRSFDSLQRFTTILSVADPNAVQNGFADTKAPNDHMFYRLFYVLNDGQFFFTAAKRPVYDTTTVKAATTGIKSLPSNADTSTKTETKPVVAKPVYTPSYYVYTKSDGDVFINLPDADKKDYSIKFYKEDGTYLFDIKNIKETGLTLDKTNFLQSGWYNFELLDNTKLVERHKFYIAKMF